MNEPARKLLLARAETFERDVIAPAVYAPIAPLEIAVAHPPTPVPPAEAHALSYNPVRLGYRWGPRWARAWFRLRWPLAAERADAVVRFSPGTEATVYVGPEPWQGLDDNRDAFAIPRDAPISGQHREIYVEAECMHPWGIQAFSWDSTETHRRWGSDDPGHVTLAALAVRSEPAWRLLCAYRFARQLLAETPVDSTLSRDLARAIDLATSAVNDRDVSATTPAALAALVEVIASGASPTASAVTATGHAHIDTAWLWTLDHTRRKCLRSWSNAVRLAERFDDFVFLCSQAYQYETVRQDAPGLFAAIQRLVRAGQWEPFGAMWVEPDCSVPSGESLVRQILHGLGAWTQHFPDAPAQRAVFLPDTFGFPASLPTIMAACGLDTFITNKLLWNQTNPFPFTSFTWRGLDGAEVLGHITPGGDYNASMTPRELVRGERRAAVSPPSQRWLQQFGFGDGGGGPTDWQIQNARLAAACPGTPRVRLGTAMSGIASLHADRLRDASLGRPWPVWDGELYLEIHRGTLTTQAELKRLNRRCEQLLREAEALDVLRRDTSRAAERRNQWRTLLLHQFHDILPGSSITAVNEQARAALGALAEELEREIQPADPAHHGEPAVWNPSSDEASGVIEHRGRLSYVRSVPALSIAPFVSIEPAAVSRDARALSNGIITATLADDGGIASLRRDDDGTELAADAAGLGTLRLFRDRPHMWDAWDIDPGYDRDEIPLPPPERIEPIDAGPLRQGFSVVRRIGERSSATIACTLDADSPRLDLTLAIDWREDHRILRIEFPTTMRAAEAMYEIPFGCISRPTHRNTPWDAARFEAPGQRWIDLSMPGRGLAVLNRSKYGFSCLGGTLGVSLLRSPTHPDPHADQGVHTIHLALVPHAGDLRAAGIPALAEQFNAPMRVLQSPHPALSAPPVVRVAGSCRLELAALKHAEDGSGDIVLRLVETVGGRGTLGLQGLVAPVLADAMERPAGPMPPELSVGPFQIVTIRARGLDPRATPSAPPAL
jgi:alpha-mannosidase